MVVEWISNSRTDLFMWMVLRLSGACGVCRRLADLKTICLPAGSFYLVCVEKTLYF